MDQKQMLEKFFETGNYVDLFPQYTGDPKWDKDARRRLHTPIVRIDPKIGRNDNCPCGSGKKYKQCCLNKEGTNDNIYNRYPDGRDNRSDRESIT